MKTIRLLDVTGDTVATFEPQDAKAEAAARELFARLKAKGTAVMTKRAEGKPDEVIKSFDQIEEGSEVILIQPIVAG